MMGGGSRRAGIRYSDQIRLTSLEALEGFLGGDLATTNLQHIYYMARMIDMED
jgi:hypothetical protein